jgi:RHH-type rel operon transcriptional repressor/antitoxin RelB
MISVNIELPKKIENHLKHLAIVSKRPEEFYIKEALIRYLEDMEDIRDILDSLEDKGEKTYTTKEVLKALDDDKKI